MDSGPALWLLLLTVEMIGLRVAMASGTGRNRTRTGLSGICQRLQRG
jgi:hypothetical protein